jgi:hypothetical protein
MNDLLSCYGLARQARVYQVIGAAAVWIRCFVPEDQFEHVQFRLTFRRSIFFSGLNGFTVGFWMQNPNSKEVMAKIVLSKGIGHMRFLARNRDVSFTPLLELA